MKIFFKLLTFVLYCVIALTINSCRKLSAYDYPPSAVSLYQIVHDDKSNFSTFQYAIDIAGLDSKLETGTYTVFAPRNATFSAAGITTASMFVMNRDSLITLIENHIIPGKIDATTLSDGQQLTALSGNKLLVQKVNGNLYLNGGDITRTNLNATNGSFNVIDNLLYYRKSIVDRLNSYYNGTSNNQFTYLVAAIIRASTGTTDFLAMLSDSTTPYTLFAPNNGAFIDGGYATVAAVTAATPAALTTILNYHIIAGRKLIPDLLSSPSTPMTAISNDSMYFNNTKTGAYVGTNCYAEGLIFSGGSANMLGGKGVIHSVSRFLSKPINMSTLARIQSDTSLTFYYAALTAASQAGGGMNFINMLSNSDSSFTVFASNNNGFRAAGYANAAAVSATNVNILTNLVEFSILRKRINNMDVAANDETASWPTLLSTSDLTFLAGTVGGAFSVQGPSNTAAIPVITRNLVTTNGLLNIIGGVLKP